MSDWKDAYAASSAVTISPAATPLASSATFVAVRESTLVDNTTNLYENYLLAGKITTGTSPTTGKEIRIGVVGLMEDSTWPDVFDGVDSDETITSVDIMNSIVKWVATISTDSTSNRTYPFGPVGIAAAFNYELPKKFVVVVSHSTGVALNSTAGNHAIYITPKYKTIT